MLSVLFIAEKSTQQHCEWLRLRGLDGGIIQVLTNRHGLYSRASNILRSRYVRVRPHAAMLYYTQYVLCLRHIVWHGARVYHTFLTQKIRGKIVVPPVVKLRHAKVVVKVDSIHGRNQ